MPVLRRPLEFGDVFVTHAIEVVVVGIVLPRVVRAEAEELAVLASAFRRLVRTRLVRNPSTRMAARRPCVRASRRSFFFMRMLSKYLESSFMADGSMMMMVLLHKRYAT